MQIKETLSYFFRAVEISHISDTITRQINIQYLKVKLSGHVITARL